MTSATTVIDDVPLALLIALTAVIVLGPIAFGVSAASRRLLGIRVGPLRTLGAGLAGVAAVAVYGQVMNDSDKDLGALSTMQIPLALFVAMTALVLLEVFLPSGSWARPLQAARGLGDRLRRARRYSQISRIFVRHGLGRVLRGRGGWQRAMRPGAYGEQCARSTRLALEECGGVFVKLGQVLSTRRDLLPPHFIEELSRLQSDALPAPWPEVEAVLHKELGKPVPEVFEWIEHVPLAAASIAQVHRARLKGGPTVAVKVQRPGIREGVERDLGIVLAVSRSLQSRLRSAGALGLRELGDGFVESVREELDFRIEARNSDAVAKATDGLEQDAPVRIPQVYYKFTSARVLVQEWLDGVTLDRAGATADRAGLDREELARTAFGSMLHQILRVGVFHADPHPGNMLLLEDGRIGLIDFGSVGRIDPSVQVAIQELLVAVDRGDPAGLHDALLSLLGTRATTHEELMPDPLLLERELGRFMARHLGVAAQADSEMFTALFRMFAQFGLAVPPEVAAVFRALATIEGTLTQLAPGFNLVEEARGYAIGVRADRLTHRLLQGRGGRAAGGFAPPTVSSLLHRVAQEVLSVLPMLRRLPRRAERISASLEEGRLGVRVRVLADERERRFVSGLIHQMTVTLLATCTGLMGVMLMVFGTGKGPRVSQQLELYPLIGYHMLAVSAILALRVLYTALRGTA
ncbi:ABC1 kinase family protein [Streptomyces poonensis]|uniref:Ubiquinone biosynthesis protein UbiB n=1 Tax=Streptomyces poonensis TaxID=68255 RepID=A0A918PXU4_9ACTN|nr:AarF/UbiB family protein [Streptomyces poonensis]GGZ25759.1 ubiquinone biosynthesis protein UbiB [Streptomyces poonensis]GLJ89083.1 ubiquinone biosynthesis protein UbiB [Streptomyces poonensis]